MTDTTNLDFCALVLGVGGIALLGLSAWELHKPDRLARMVGLGWLLHAVAAGVLAASLSFMAGAAHLPRGQRPIALSSGLGLGGCLLLGAGCAVLFRVGAAREQAAKPAAEPEALEAAGGVWPPPPQSSRAAPPGAD